MRFKAAEATTIIVAAIALVGSLISAFYTYANSNRELDIKLVEIGISILRADPKDSQTHGAREWAINIIEKFSGQRFSEAAKNELLQNRLRYVVTRTVTQTHISSSSNDILDSDPPNKSGGGSRDALPKD